MWQVRQEQGAAEMVAALALGEQHQYGPAPQVTDGVQLGIQPALGAADAARSAPFCTRLAAMPCALRWVLSTINSSGIPASAARAAKVRSKTPMRLQRVKQL